MKTSLLAAAVTAAMLFAGNAAAATITFNGAVTDRTCTVTGGPGTGGTGGNLTVAMPSVPAADVTAAGTGDTGFALNITGTGSSGACRDGTTAKLFWNVFQANIDNATNSLRNTVVGPTGAGGTGIALFNGGGARIDLNNPGEANNQAATLASGTAQLRYIAKYVSVGTVTPGTVQSALEYIVEFN